MMIPTSFYYCSHDSKLVQACELFVVGGWFLKCEERLSNRKFANGNTTSTIVKINPRRIASKSALVISREARLSSSAHGKGFLLCESLV